MTGGINEDEVRALRHKLGVRPVFKRIDTCAAEFDAKTPYMYSTYEAPSFGEPEDEAMPSDRRKIVILGGGPNRIGQGIEFDYCCCHACFALEEAGFETIMVNCNPETVSTDYDTSDRLYFEPLTAEDVLEILHVGAVAGRAGRGDRAVRRQTPLNLARALEKAGIPILGTSPDAIDLAEDRERFAGAGQQIEAAPAGERHRAQPRRGFGGRAPDRLSRADAGRATFLAGGRWRSSTRTGSSTITSTPPSRCRAIPRCWSTSICATRSRSTSTRSATATTSWSRAYSSLSRRQGSIRATAPVQSHPIRCRMRSSPRSSGRRTRSRGG